MVPILVARTESSMADTTYELGDYDSVRASDKKLAGPVLGDTAVKLLSLRCSGPQASSRPATRPLHRHYLQHRQREPIQGAHTGTIYNIVSPRNLILPRRARVKLYECSHFENDNDVRKLKAGTFSN